VHVVHDRDVFIVDARGGDAARDRHKADSATSNESLYNAERWKEIAQCGPWVHRRLGLSPLTPTISLAPTPRPFLHRLRSQSVLQRSTFARPETQHETAQNANNRDRTKSASARAHVHVHVHTHTARSIISMRRAPPTSCSHRTARAHTLESPEKFVERAPKGHYPSSATLVLIPASLVCAPTHTHSSRRKNLLRERRRVTTPRPPHSS